MPSVRSLADVSARPALWGFFISLALLVFSLLLRTWYPGFLENNWAERQEHSLRNISGEIDHQFRQRSQFLNAQVSRVFEDQELFQRIREGTPARVAELFGRIESLRFDNTVSLEITDPQGTVLLWAGRSVVPQYKNILQQQSADSFLVISRASLHRFLSAGKMTGDHRFCVVASQPLELNFPLSNRFVSRYSFSGELSKSLDVPIRLTFEDESIPPVEGEYAVPLKNFEERTIAQAVVRLQVLEEEVQRVNATWRGITALSVMMATGFMVVLLWRRLSFVHSVAMRVLTWLVVVWGIRLGWRIVDAPSVVLGGIVFDPAVYASPFAMNLTSSLGELFLSCLAVLGTVLILVRGELHRVITMEEGKAPAVLRKGSSLLTLLVWSLGIPWVIRGYGAAIRSFVFDSTISYQDPGSLVPSLATGIMHINIFLLSLSLLLIVVAGFSASARSLARLFSRLSFRVLSLIVLGSFLAGFALFSFINRVPQVPVWMPPLLFVLVFVFLNVLKVPSGARESLPGLSMKDYGFLLLGAFILSALTLDAKIHEKDRQQVETFAQELLRPIDGWLSFVVTEGLNAAHEQFAAEFGRGVRDSSRGSERAFNLWAQMLMSREGYNSGVYIYDREGREISNFSVGLTSYEEYELLTRTFDAEEEALLVFERNLPQGRVKYYGAWGTIRDSQGRPMGTIAIGLSASQRFLFRGETPELLRSAGPNQFDQRIRTFSVTEYIGGILASTTNTELARGERVRNDLLEAGAWSQDRFVWVEEQVGGIGTEVLYARDPSQAERIVAIHLGFLDIRWHVFNLVKMLLVYGMMAGFVVLLMLALRLGRRPFRSPGFREKLVTSFAILSIVPLVVLAYYNRDLAVDRFNETIGRRLSQELDLVEQRILSTVLDEEDFLSGVNDDFCEMVATDLGIDFTVYGRTSLQASSRSELYKASILDGRLHGPAFANAVLLGKKFYKDSEQIGSVRYIVGYRALYLGERFLGVLAVPALYRLQEIDEELAQRNAFLLGAYAVVVLVIIVIAVVLANRLSKPLRELSAAVQRVGRGELDIRIPKRSSDEVGELVDSFNEMTGELKASRENLVRVERELAWKEMAKQVAHEIKNPLTPMKLSMQHLVQAHRDGISNFGEILDRVGRTVVDQIEALSRIASEFSNFARMPVRTFERVDVNELLRETVLLFAEVRGVEFRTNYSEVPMPMIADKDELRRALINILRNSVQALEEGGIVTIDSSVQNARCRIVIRDNGPGIPEEIQAKVFQPNFSTKTDGMGIGLAITRKVIEDLDGRISLRSTVGEGTVVEIILPVSPR
ncbi:MAG: HAMP domain-containing protein [Ignavibacteriales bacterium]|nr:HAMP domain-containing protein [Ignavibacteriales bacterium]